MHFLCWLFRVKVCHIIGGWGFAWCFVFGRGEVCIFCCWRSELVVGIAYSVVVVCVR